MTPLATPLSYQVTAGDDVGHLVDELARLRIAVFADWPYLYDGDPDYEARYLARFAASTGAVVVIARDPDGRIVGAATGAPLADHADEFAAPFAAAGLDPADFFYHAESVLLAPWRGHGAGREFFRLREAAARAQGFRRAAFCSVIRPDDHPARPEGQSSLEPFWRRLGYSPLPGLVAQFSWRDRGEAGDSVKPMQLWSRTLG
ncbi:GNAT family N-acetyltransferase [Hoeflea marina]|nr:GNAT family N-acetyltransferase [Hoeflea marina]